MSDKKITYKPKGSKTGVTIYGDSKSNPYKAKVPASKPAPGKKRPDKDR